MNDFGAELWQILDGAKQGEWSFYCLKTDKEPCACNDICTELLNLHKQIVELHERIFKNIDRQK